MLYGQQDHHSGFTGLLIRAAEGGVERRGRWLDPGECPNEGERVAGADDPVHAGVLPLHRDRAVIADAVEHPEARLPRHLAVAGGHEVPAAPRITPRQVRAQPAVAPVEPGRGLLAVDVVNAVAEVVEKADRVQVLPHEMARVEVEPERRPTTDRLQ